jgi:hypothetical protein
MLRYSLLIVITFLALMPCAASAAYNIEKIGDWKYRAYACNAVIIYLETLSQAEKGNSANKIDTPTEQKEAEQFIIDDVLSTKPSLISHQYPFDQGDAQMIALITMTLHDGLLEDNHKPDAINFNRRGFDVCIGFFDKMDKKIKDSMK